MSAVWLLIGLSAGAATVAALLRPRLRRLTAAAERVPALERERDLAVARCEDARAGQAALENTFKALSADALQRNSTQFIELAKAQLASSQTEAKAELESRQRAVEQLVAPLREQLGKVDEQLGRLERDRQRAQGALGEQLRTLAEQQERLRSETGSLVAALRQPQARGRWGEMQLRRVVELAGMLAHCDFVEQTTVQSDGGLLRPDLVVQMPGGRQVVVDAKAPLQAVLDAHEAKSDEERQGHIQAHARLVREHLRKLGAKRYTDQFETPPELVLMFLPGEHFYNAALEGDPALIEEGVRNGVLIATPTTLIALLRAVAYGWQQERMAQSAREISDLGRELHQRLGTFTGHVQKLGSRLATAVGAYNEAVGSLESRVLPQARRFSEHGAVPEDQDIPALQPVAASPRPLAAPELDDDGEIAVRQLRDAS